MTKKDLNTSENIDRDQNVQKDWESHHTTTDRFPDDAKGIAETEVKNAHAAGDGALERSDKNLTDVNDAGLFHSNEDEGQQDRPVDPPY